MPASAPATAVVVTIVMAAAVVVTVVITAAVIITVVIAAAIVVVVIIVIFYGLNGNGIDIIQRSAAV